MMVAAAAVMSVDALSIIISMTLLTAANDDVRTRDIV